MFITILICAAIYGGWKLNTFVSNIGEPQKKVLKASISGATSAVQNKIDSMTSKSR